MMGSFFFYWGTRGEGTPSWFNAILHDGRSTQITHELSNVLGDQEESYPGPILGYILLQGQGAPSSIILPPGKEVTASIHDASPHLSELSVQWEIRPENWFRAGKITWESTAVWKTTFNVLDPGNMVFQTPEQEGPYRLYLYLEDQEGRVATANIPFYVLNPEDAE
jgi:hypothetical protein